MEWETPPKFELISVIGYQTRQKSKKVAQNFSALVIQVENRNKNVYGLYPF